MMLTKAKSALQQNFCTLSEARWKGARIELAKRMGVSDGTLGRIKYGTGNPTVEVLEQIAAFFKVEPWELLKPTESAPGTLEELMTLATPRSRSALDAIVRAAERNELTEDDLVLLQRIAERFMGESR